METYALVLILLQGSTPRLQTVIPGYTRDACERAVYMIQTSPPLQAPQAASSKEPLKPVAYCVIGPAAPAKP